MKGVDFVFSAVYIIDGVLWNVKLSTNKDELIQIIQKQHDESFFRPEETVIEIWDENENVVFNYEKDILSR